MLAVAMADNKVTRTVTVTNHEGFHLRAASLVMNLARRFESHVSIAKGNHTEDAKDTPLQLVGLDAHQGDALVLRATGPDADKALEALAGLFASEFEETSDGSHEEVSQGQAAEEGMNENGPGG